jgi:hypothetical protein
MAGRQMIDTRCKAARGRRPHLEAETAQNAAQAHLALDAFASTGSSRCGTEPAQEARGFGR